MGELPDACSGGRETKDRSRVRPGELVVLTGAAGRVGRLVWPGLAERYRLRLSDLHADGSERGLTGWEGRAQEYQCGDLSSAAVAHEVTAEAAAVVHLAAEPRPRASWESLRPANMEALVQVLTAARDNDVRKVVLASTIHAAGGYHARNLRPVEPSWPPWPCCVYGATKVFAEALARVYADSSEMSAICLRLGGVGAEMPPRGERSTWVGPEDLTSLVVAALEAERSYGIYFGVSREASLCFSVRNAREEIGYEPRQG